MGIILSIDTSSKNCSVSLSKDGILMSIIEENSESFSHANNLHFFCEKIIHKANLNLSDVDAYAFSEGPGSYTGLRIGAAAVKGFAFCFDKPVISISTLKAMAFAYKDKNEFLCPVIDSRKGEVYLAIYDSNLKIVLEPQSYVISQNSIDKFIKKNRISFFGTGIEKLKKQINHKNASFIEGVYPSSKYIVELAQESYLNKNFVDISNFEPSYLKEFITTKQKKNIF
jgi:tRNA threonylcarbamoyladenosine biosynthesis protein TsaB